MPVGHRPQPPVGTVRVAITGTVLTHRFATVFYLRLTDDGTRTINDLNSILTAIGTNYNTDVRPNISGDVVVTQIAGVWITSVGQQLTSSVAVNYAGSAPVMPADAASCFVVDWKISDFYRGGHPRTYFPGPSASTITTGSTIAAGTLTTLVTAFNAWRNHINALTATHVSQVEMGTVRYQSAGAWLAPPVFRAYTGCSIRSLLGTQRRRLKH